MSLDICSLESKVCFLRDERSVAAEGSPLYTQSTQQLLPSSEIKPSATSSSCPPGQNASKSDQPAATPILSQTAQTGHSEYRVSFHPAGKGIQHVILCKTNVWGKT
ncbi:hypothetical protein CRV24_009013 [Beauveria bassiana]|nr:hypothetical protein CRV24_009013 [Beauveria bassiana]